MCREFQMNHILAAIQEAGYDRRCAEVEPPEYALPPYDEHDPSPAGFRLEPQLQEVM